MDTLKNLGQIAPVDTAVTVLYTVPSKVSPSYDGGNIEAFPDVTGRFKQTVISSIVVSHLTTSTDTLFSIIVTPEFNTVVANEHYLAKDIPLAATSTRVLHFGIMIGENYSIRVQSSHANRIAFNAFGVEIS